MIFSNAFSLTRHLVFKDKFTEIYFWVSHLHEISIGSGNKVINYCYQPVTHCLNQFQLSFMMSYMAPQSHNELTDMVNQAH